MSDSCARHFDITGDPAAVVQALEDTQRALTDLADKRLE